MAEDEETEFPAQLIAPIISNAELDRLIVDLGTNPLAKENCDRLGKVFICP